MERWDGIGGQMKEATKRHAAAGKPRGNKAPGKTFNSGKAKLNAAADKTLEEHSEEIASALYDSLVKGNLTSAKLLFDLADGKIDCEDEVVMSRLYSYAEKLASEPEWQGDTAAETGLEDGEPED